MNKKMTCCLCLTALILIPGCLTTAEYKLGKFNNYIGQDKAVLTSKWGTPHRTVSKQDKTYMSYKLRYENPGDRDMYTFEINSDGIIEDITLKRITIFGLEVDHWPQGNGIPSAAPTTDS